MPFQNPVAELDERECWRLLSHNSLGRLAMRAPSTVDIFPINYLVVEGSILMRTAPGTKLLELVVAPNVALEIDGYTDHDAWSVVAKGRAHRLELQHEIDAADELPLVPWIPTLKYTYVKIVVDEVSGRRFERAVEPERY
jgi:nitroimidazol reductase NimA-like FMN-containing flavoprotein (pyridoxamine 5'-phosphate oxidase superfamily)